MRRKKHFSLPRLNKLSKIILGLAHENRLVEDLKFGFNINQSDFLSHVQFSEAIFLPFFHI